MNQKVELNQAEAERRVSGRKISFLPRIMLCVFILQSFMIFGIIMSAAGCAPKSMSSRTRIMFTLTDTDEPFRLLLRNSVQSEAAALGIQLDIRYAGGSKDAQIDAVLAANREKYDAIICFPVDPSNALELEEAAGDLPIVFVNNVPVGEVLTKDHYMYVGCKESDAGYMQADYVWKRLGCPEQMQAVLVKGEPGHSGTVGRTSAVKNYFKEKGVHVDWVYEDYANWAEEEAADKFRLFMKKNIPFDAVFSNNDTMALGVLNVMQENGMDIASIPVVGVDATPMGCRSIKNNQMSFSVYQNGINEGSTAVRLAKKLAVEKTAEGFEGLDEDGLRVWIPYEPVDRDNVDEYLDR